MKMDTCTIYCLYDSRAKKVFYVGRSRVPLGFRLSNHITNISSQKKLNKRQRKSLKKRIHIYPIETFNYSLFAACTKEVFWINKLIEWGYPIKNKLKGSLSNIAPMFQFIPKDIVHYYIPKCLLY